MPYMLVPKMPSHLALKKHIFLFLALVFPFATALLPISKMMMKQPLLLLPKDVSNGLALQAAATDGTDDLLLRYESKHPESEAVAAAYAETTLRTSRPKMVVFDKDGTLGDCTASLRRWVLHMTKRLRRDVLICDQKETESIMQDFHRRVGWDAIRNDVVPSAPLAAGTWDQIGALVYEFLLQYSSQCREQPVTYEFAQTLSLELEDLHGQDPPVLDLDLKAILRACQQLGYVVAVCTSDDRVGTDCALKAWGVDSVIDVSVCGDEVSQGKPSAAPLQVLCQRANKTKQRQRQLQGTSASTQFLPGDCIVVGDTTADTGMARAANAGFCVGVLTGSGTAEQLLNTGAHLILPDIGHIPALLETLEQLAKLEGQESQ